MGRGQSDFEIGCGWSLGALGRKFLIKGLRKGPPSHLFFRFHLKARGGKRRREKSHRLGRGGGSGRAGAEAPYSHTYPPNFPGRGWGGVWVWVLRKERYPLPTTPTPPACPPKPESGPTGFPEEVSGPRSAGAYRRARAGTQLLRESPSPPKSPKLAATSKDARNLHLAL